MDRLESVAALRALYAEPRERAVKKQLDRLDPHCIRLVGLAPFVVVATAGADGALDASPRGGPPGFVRGVDDRTLLLPDAPGNNRLDSFGNIVVTGRIGMLFMIPGVDETLRINGTALLSTAAGDIARCTDERRAPRAVVRVGVLEAYLHCPKAFMRSRLWDPVSRVDRATLPTLGRMIADQTGLGIPPETDEEMRRRYAADL
jgi:PPOX class probable FMN-dependent enzyme